MSDTSNLSTTTAPAIRINNTWKVVVAFTVLLFNCVIICWLLLKGKSDNSLHASALSWSYTMSAGILISLGFSAVSDMILAIFGKKS